MMKKAAERQPFSFNRKLSLCLLLKASNEVGYCFTIVVSVKEEMYI